MWGSGGVRLIDLLWLCAGEEYRNVSGAFETLRYRSVKDACEIHVFLTDEVSERKALVSDADACAYIHVCLVGSGGAREAGERERESVHKRGYRRYPRYQP